jgi:hypothetical protein
VLNLVLPGGAGAALILTHFEHGYLKRELLRSSQYHCHRSASQPVLFSVLPAS